VAYAPWCGLVCVCGVVCVLFCAVRCVVWYGVSVVVSVMCVWRGSMWCGVVQCVLWGVVCLWCCLAIPQVLCMYFVCEGV
jgi:hypothetical protein